MKKNVKGTYKAIVSLVFITILGCVSIHEPQYEPPPAEQQPTWPTVDEQPPPGRTPESVTQLEQNYSFPEPSKMKMQQPPPYPPPEKEERPNAEMQCQ